MIVSPYPATHPSPQNFRTSHLKRGSSVIFSLSWKLKRQRAFTWAVETPTSSDVKHGAGDGEQNPPAINSTELFQRAWGIRREEYRRCVSAGHPRVTTFKLRGGRARDGSGREDYALKEIESVEEEGSVDGMREREGHLVGGWEYNLRRETHFGFLSDVEHVLRTYVIPPPAGIRGALKHTELYMLQLGNAAEIFENIRSDASHTLAWF